MASGLTQDFSWAAKGCEAMSFFVRFSYAFTAALKIVEDGVEGETWDIVLVEGD